MWWYVYVLQSLKDNSWYIGCTDDLKTRLIHHNRGYSKYTKDKLPWKLIYYECGLNKIQAFRREIYLKSGYGRRYLKQRVGQIDLER